MSSYHERLVLSRHHEFQPIVGHRDWDKVPTVVARQTNVLLGLLSQRVIRNSDPARDYLRDYTFAYLKDAEEGSSTLYDTAGVIIEDVDLEVREAAGHALVSFAHLPDFVTSPLVSKGFSRKGMLRAPETRQEFLRRIRELKIGLWQMVAGEIDPEAHVLHPSFLRLFGFFKVGAELPIKLSESERVKDQRERAKFADLLKDIDISL